MQFKIFTISTADNGAAMEEMNKFLRAHKVLEVEQQLVTGKAGSQWHFCVKYLAGVQPELPKGQTAAKIDYKEVLDERTFAVFSTLREVRKKIAEEDGLPVYAVFTNEELSNIAALEEITTAALVTVNGIGQKKAERFGKRLIEYMTLAGLPP